MRRAAVAIAAFFVAAIAASAAYSATGCGAQVDKLFARASSAYSSGDWALTSADMQEAASDYAACGRHARTESQRDRLTYYYGASLYVAGEAEAKLHHTDKVRVFWNASASALGTIRNSRYLTSDQHALVTHALTVINATVKALGP